MHTKHGMYQRRNQVKIQKVRTQHCPCLKITAGCTAAKFPELFFAAMEQGENSCPLSQETILT